MFSTTWKLPKKYVDEEKVMEQESKTANMRLFSFVSEIDEQSIEKVSTNIQSIINYNLEREEKDQLFQEKVNELKTLFEKQSLKNLKQLKFEFKQTKIELEDNIDEVREGAKLVSERD